MLFETTGIVRFDFLGRQEAWYTHAHTRKHGLSPSRREELDVGLILYRGCRNVQSLSMTPARTDSAA